MVSVWQHGKDPYRDRPVSVYLNIGKETVKETTVWLQTQALVNILTQKYGKIGLWLNKYWSSPISVTEKNVTTYLLLFQALNSWNILENFIKLIEAYTS